MEGHGQKCGCKKNARRMQPEPEPASIETGIGGGGVPTGHSRELYGVTPVTLHVYFTLFPKSSQNFLNRTPGHEPQLTQTRVSKRDSSSEPLNPNPRPEIPDEGKEETWDQGRWKHCDPASLIEEVAPPGPAWGREAPLLRMTQGCHS